MNTKQLLQQYYEIFNEQLPQQREKSKWKVENKYGFLLGLLAHGIDSHQTLLHSLLANNQFSDQEHDFIESMFDYYIRPFHMDFNDACQTLPSISSGTKSRSSSLDYIPKVKELTHNGLKKAVEKRDGVCLFCWGERQLHVAHIISQKDIPITIDEESTLRRAGLTQKHQVQNGLLLCSVCHGEFDQLKQYVDFVENKLVVKFVDYSVFPNDKEHIKWQKEIRDLKIIRSVRKDDWNGIYNRQAVESNGEMALYFVINNPDLLPNIEALKFHKKACLIWRMAGGAESEDEYCPYEDDGVAVPISYGGKNLGTWLDSSATLILENRHEN